MSETREKLLAAARRIYVEEGLGAFGLRKVAREVGISAPAVYRHFASKEALLAAAVADSSHVFLRYLTRGLCGSTPLLRLSQTGEAYLDFALENPQYYKLMFMSPTDDLGLEGISEDASRDFAPTFQFLVDRVRECLESGDLAPDDPERLSALIWANCHGLVSLRLAKHFEGIEPDGFRALYLSGCASFLRGLRPAGSAS